LSVRETSDGVLLLHCFTGCAPASIVAAIGLQLADLFPRIDEPHAKPKRRPPVPWPDLITRLGHGLMVLIIAISDLERGKTFSSEDLDTLRAAAVAMHDAVEAARHV